MAVSDEEGEAVEEESSVVGAEVEDGSTVAAEEVGVAVLAFTSAASHIIE